MTSVASIDRAAANALPARAAAPAALAPRILAADDVPAIHDLHRRLCASAPPGSLRQDSNDFFRGILAGKGAILGLEATDGALAAYGVLSLPAPDDFHYGRIIPLPENLWPQIAQLEGIGVAPAWQGHGLQQWLGLWRMNTAIELGYRHICATVAPENFYSWRNLLALGLRIRGLHPLYGGYARYVAHRDALAPAQPAPDREIAVADLRTQTEAFAAGGFAYDWRGSPPESLLFALPGGRG